MRNGDYELIVAPEEYPGKKYRGRYAYEHRVAYWREHGTLPPVVHHDNHRKRDNAPSNLVGKSSSEHTADHGRERRKPDVEVRCGWCGEAFMTRRKDYDWKVRTGRTTFFCSRSHGTLAHQERLRNTRRIVSRTSAAP